MNKKPNSITILSLPKKIKLKLFIYLNKTHNIKIVGYKKIRQQHYVPLIEISNYIRIWTLLPEIKI